MENLHTSNEGLQCLIESIKDFEKAIRDVLKRHDGYVVFHINLNIQGVQQIGNNNANSGIEKF
jgi:hypothetical protein